MQLEELGKNAKEVESFMRVLDTNKKNEVLRLAAENLKKDSQRILEANEKDMETGRKKGISFFKTGKSKINRSSCGDCTICVFQCVQYEF